MLSGVSYLLSLGIVFRDIKPHDLLITNSGTLKQTRTVARSIYSLDLEGDDKEERR